MKHKIFSLVLLGLLCSIGNAWGDVLCSANLSGVTSSNRSNGSDDGTNCTISWDGFSDITSSSNYVDAEDGNRYYKLSGNDKCVTLALTSGSFQAGDVVKVKVTATGSTTVGFKLKSSSGNSATMSSGGKQKVVEPSYTLTAGDIESNGTIKILRYSSSTFMYSFTVEGTRDSRPGLTISFTPDNQNITASGSLNTSLSWTEDTSGESAKYTVSYSSSDEDVATVNSSGVITGVDEGSATITATVTAASDASYKTTKATITVNVVAPFALNANFLTPTAVLDLSDADAASAALTVKWTKDNPYYGNDGKDNYVVVSPYTVYQDEWDWSAVPKNGESRGGNSGTTTWSSSDVFLGSTYYTQENNKARYASSRSDRVYNKYSYRIKGVSKVKLLYKSGGNTVVVNLGAFEINAGVASSSTMQFAQGTNNELGILTVDGLDAAKEYLIAVDNNTTNNSSLYELAFFYDADIDIHASISLSHTYETYVTNDALDFSGVDGLTAYVATGADASTVTIEPVTAVPANTPLVLKGAGKHTVPVTAPCDAPATNYLVAGTGATINSASQYVLSIQGVNYVFAPTDVDAPIVPVGKAYLDLSSAAVGAPGLLRIVEGEQNATAVQNLEAEGEVVKFIENGQLFIKKNGITYDALGRVIR